MINRSAIRQWGKTRKIASDVGENLERCTAGSHNSTLATIKVRGRMLLLPALSLQDELGPVFLHTHDLVRDGYCQFQCFSGSDGKFALWLNPTDPLCSETFFPAVFLATARNLRNGLLCVFKINKKGLRNISFYGWAPLLFLLILSLKKPDKICFYV